MNNGDRLTGTITQQDKDIVFLNLPYSGQVQLPRTHIDRIEQQKLQPVAPEAVAETPTVVIKNQPVRHYSVDLTAGKKRSSSSTDNLGFKTSFEQRDDTMRLTIFSNRNCSGAIKSITRRILLHLIIKILI